MNGSKTIFALTTTILLLSSFSGCLVGNDNASIDGLSSMRIGDEFIYEGEGNLLVDAFPMPVGNNKASTGIVQMVEGDRLRVVISGAKTVMDSYSQLHPSFIIDYHHESDDEELHVYREYVSLVTGRLVYSTAIYVTTQPVGWNSFMHLNYVGQFPAFGAVLFTGDSIPKGTWNESHPHPDPNPQFHNFNFSSWKIPNYRIESNILNSDDDEFEVRLNVTMNMHHNLVSTGGAVMTFSHELPFPLERKATFIEGGVSTLRLVDWTRGEGPPLVIDEQLEGGLMVDMNMVGWDHRFPGDIPYALQPLEDAYQQALNAEEVQEFLAERESARLTRWGWNNGDNSGSAGGVNNLPNNFDSEVNTWNFYFADENDSAMAQVIYRNRELLSDEWSVKTEMDDSFLIEPDENGEPKPKIIPLESFLDDLSVICPKLEPQRVSMKLSHPTEYYSVGFGFTDEQGDQWDERGVSAGEPSHLEFSPTEGRFIWHLAPMGGPNPCEPYLP